MADAYLSEADQAIRQLKLAADIERSKTMAAVLNARILINRGKLADAESLLQANVETFSKASVAYANLSLRLGHCWDALCSDGQD